MLRLRAQPSSKLLLAALLVGGCSGSASPSSPGVLGAQLATVPMPLPSDVAPQTMPGAVQPGAVEQGPIPPGATPESPAPADPGTVPSPATGQEPAAAPVSPPDPNGTDGLPAPLTLPASCTAGAVNVGATPLTRLSSAQYRNSVERLLGVEVDVNSLSNADERGGAFVANLSVALGESETEQYRTLSHAASELALDRLGQLLPCQSRDAACANQFIVETGARAFRRPLTATQEQGLMAVYDAGGDFETGIQLVIEAMLQSPRFIYQIVGDGTQVAGPQLLDGYDLAERLSFALQNTIPDDDLFAAAASGELETPAGLRAHAERLLQTDEGGEMLADFHEQWLGLGSLGSIEKDADLFPEFGDSLRDSMLNETRRFVDHVIRKGDATLHSLFNAPYTFADETLLDLYGIDAPDGHDANEPLPLSTDERGGLLTHASLMAANAHGDQSSPIMRGVLVRTNFLCETIPDPPGDVDDTPPEPDANATTRERFALHTSNAACAGCHSLIDPVGLAFENYDAIGAFRYAENGQAIDNSGVLNGFEGGNLEFNGVRELSEALAQSRTAQACVADQWFQYLLSRPKAPEDVCSSMGTQISFAESGHNIRDLVLAVVTSDSFRHLAEVSQ